MITRTAILLQYPKAGEIGPLGNPTSANDAEKFVALDAPSGGYPYATEIQNAHDFKTVDEAERYRGHFKGVLIRHVTISYEVK